MVETMSTYVPDVTRLAEKHISVVHSIASQLKRRYRWIDQDELYSYSFWGLTKAAQAYDPTSDVPFPSFARSKGMFLAIDQMRQERVLQKVRPDAGRPRFVSLPDLVENDQEFTEHLADDRSEAFIERLECGELLTDVMRRLGGEDRQLLGLYYLEGLTFSEIARLLGTSASVISTRHKCILDRLRTSAEAQLT
jgi:RNA polymerase sigma factor (sigma-70 family)